MHFMGGDGASARERFPQHLFDDLAEPPPDVRLAERAAEAFPSRFQGMSAKTGLDEAQSRFVGRSAATLGILGLFAPGLILTGLGTLSLVIFVLIIAYRLVLAIFGDSRAYLLTDPASLSLLLPVYTILIALKDEAACMPQLSDSLMSLEYPRHLLDVKLLLEAGDDATKDAIHAQIWPEGTEVLVLPPGDPKTKPRALNYGLGRARGAFVTVYDAEDRPNPGQLMEAARRFAWDPDLACVQAPLSGNVRFGSWLSRHWALEYAIQFHRLMPALARLGMPIPLGGTSNHFRRRALLASGGWDAWNVTEDADLGLRFARLGKKIDVIAPSTVELPPQHLNVWLGQRSRWLKGFVQTWLVLMREPVTAAREMGALRFVSMQLTLGASILSALFHLPWLVWCVVCIVSPDANLSRISWAMLTVSYAVGAVTALTVPSASFAIRMRDLITLPFYWPLQFFAMARALYSLARRPHYWVKTPREGVPGAGGAHQF
jgi:cellulose synthase/poly-beta-1,6-N-acetylglucosamine synthase-like glycosyltransferase